MSEHVLLEDARWSCRACGKCCEGFSFGPVEPNIIQSLVDKKIAEHWPAAEKEWYSKHPQSGEYFLHHVDGHCIFLQEDKLCRIHALFGEEAKPWFCREYPFHVVEEPRGLAIRVREDCGGFHKSYLDGKPMAEHVAGVLRIPRVVARQQYKNMNVIILPGVAVSTDTWSKVEGVLLGYVKEEKQPHEIVQTVRNKLLLMAGRQEQEGHPEKLTTIFASLLKYFVFSLQQLVVAPHITEKKQKLISLLQLALANLSEPLGEIEPMLGRYFNLIIRGRLLGKTFASIGGIPNSLGLFLFETMMLRLAAGSDDVHVIGPMMSQWRRIIMLQPIWLHLRKLEKPLTNLFLYA